MRKMLTTVFMVFCSFSTNAQVTEDFNYSGQLNANGWSIHSGTTNFISTTTGLTYSGYANSNIGNAAQISNLGGEDINLGFTEYNTDGQTVFASFLVNVNEAASSKTGDYFFNLGDRVSSTSFTSFCARVGVKITSDVVNFGISNTSTISYGTTAFAKNTTYLLIVKYTISTAGNDPVSLWVKSSGVPADEAAAGTAEAVSTTTAGTNVVDAVALRQGSSTLSSSIIVDGLRIGSTWNAAPLPVELVSFSAITNGRGVELAWKTATEVNNAGFEIQRSEVGGQWSKVGFVEGNGTTNAPKSYSFVDASAKGTVSYRLKQIDRDGQFEYSSVVNATVAMTAADYELSQNFPNPFNPNTNITFAMKNSENVNVTVYNALGQVVATLFNDVANANQVYTLSFDGKNLSSGTYFYALRSASRNEVRKMSLMK